MNIKRTMNLIGAASLLCIPLVAGYGAPPTIEWPIVQRTLSECVGVYTNLPRDVITGGYTGGALLGNGEIGATIGGVPESQTVYLNRMDYWVRALGGLSITATAGSDPAQFRYEQDLATAEIRARITINGNLTDLTTWVAANEPLLIMKVTNGSSRPATYTFSPWTKGESDGAIKLGASSSTSRASSRQTDNVNQPFAPANAGRCDGVSWAWRERTEKFTARAVIACRILDAGQVEFHGSRQDVKLKPGATATVVVAVYGKGGLDSEVKNIDFYRRQAVERVNRQTTASVAALAKERLDWWRSFWLKSHVDLGDQLLNRYWHGAFYALACSSRAGNPCPGLWGVWITTDTPKWTGNYYNNYNFQSPFYGVFSGNHPELAEPFFETALGALPFFSPLTQAAGYRGVVVPRRWGMIGYGYMRSLPVQCDPAATKNRKLVPNDQLDSTMFNTMNFIERYETTLDPAFQRDMLYPMLRACVDFFGDYLVLEPVPGAPEKARYVLKESGAREGTGTDINPAYPLGYLRRVYSAALDASRELNCDADRRALWQDILARLSDYPSTVVDGKRCFKESEDRDCVTLHGPGDNASLLQFICPGNQVGLDSPTELLETARNTIRYLTSGKSSSWNQGNNLPQIFAYAARVGWDAEELYQALRTRVEKEMRSNLTIYQRGGGIESSGATEAIHSMLMQSHEGVIRLFPVWPRNRNAEFCDLRAHGAFLVSAALRNGTIENVRMVSEKGRQCTVQNPWPGRKVTLDGSRFLEGDRVTFETKPGQVITVAPANRRPN